MQRISRLRGPTFVSRVSPPPERTYKKRGGKPYRLPARFYMVILLFYRSEISLEPIICPSV